MNTIMKAKLYQQDGTVKGQIDLPEAVFGAEVNEKSAASGGYSIPR